jgi:four helix bundle protein
MKKSEEFKNRLIDFTFDILKLLRKLPKTAENIIFIKQIIRSASSIGANYAEAMFAHSRIEFIHCINISRKEVSETIYWLEMLRRANPNFEADFGKLLLEATEILKILIASIKTAKQNNK